MDELIFTAPASVNTPTSPNTNVVTTPSGDPNNTTTMSFQYQNRIPVWTPFVSQATPTNVLEKPITIGTTTWHEGITVQYAALGAEQYTVTIVSGFITDANSRYNLAGVTLGIFPIKKSLTVEEYVVDPNSLPEAIFQALQSVNTPLSPNVNVVTTPSGDANNTTTMSFQYQGRIPMWTPFVSQAVTESVLENSVTIGSTTMHKGITVQYSALSSTQYTVSIVKGMISDGSSSYNLAGVTLGIFPIS
ncbi:MAG: hypothetical protein F6J92_03405 [Symploca sp. SIO1A3]|nr:hypothetical protein [Symploca sp. SIO1A3]